MEMIDLGDAPAEMRESLFRLQQRTSLLKWAIGTIGLTLITSIASWYFQNREVRLEEIRFEHERKIRELEFEQKYLGEFLEFALVEDIDSRVRFAHYFASVSTSDILSAKWAAYHADLIKSAGTSDNATAADRIGGVEALTGRKITRIWLGAEAAAPIADFHDYHVNELGWADVGFHYYVDVDGAVHLARPVGRSPAFVLNHNSNAIAIAIACDHWTKVSEEPPEGLPCTVGPKQREAIHTLTAKLLLDYGLAPDTIGKRSDFRPVPDLLGNFVTDMQLTLTQAPLGPQSNVDNSENTRNGSP